MGKKSKKNRFNQSVDVDIVYSSNTIAEMDPTDNLAELNLSSEKAEELQKIRAKLPTFTSTSSVESELAKLPMDKPFRAFVYNVSYLATEIDVEQFFSPLRVTNINIVNGSGGSRGFCFVDFASREDLAKALERSDSSLAGRQVNVRIAAPNSSERAGFMREKNSSGMRRTEMPFERRGGYKPSVLRDDSEDNESIWKRGFVSRSSDFGSSGFAQNRSQLSLDPNHKSTPPGERPKLNLLPRTVQRDSDGQIFKRNSKIFGEARPVDTASKNREVEQRLSSTVQTSILNP
ncbi:hypothetical protein MN116_007927 [Schistosoma mekongi]|uniref:RRM domain-containing protein n=1 Tax=Schistosoma mekongi TaxID=38744 RepID=A0AAE1Z7H3_SCHME|nr:hypothetical protein MN116_007927 [Schistosoma mekongi]